MGVLGLFFFIVGYARFKNDLAAILILCDRCRVWLVYLQASLDGPELQR